jgi:hypothetical protein
MCDRRVRGATAFFVMALLIGACGGSAKPTALKTHSPSPSPPPSMSSATTAPTWSAAQRSIITAYTGFWAALPKASRADAAMVRAQLLIPVTTDPELSQLISTMQRQQQQHQRMYGDHQAHVQSVEISDGKATLRDCQDASRAGIETTNGRKLTVGVKHNPVVATLLMRGKVWKVSTIEHPAGTTC